MGPQASPPPTPETAAQRPRAARTSDAEKQALALIVAGTATSRAELRERLGISASTASALVRRLIESGLVSESEHGTSTGGRRPARLQAAANDSAWLVAELGSSHMRVGLSTADGRLEGVREHRMNISEGHAASVTALAASWRELIDEHPASTVLAGAVAVPGPVSALTGDLIAPARMPGWHGAPFARDLAEELAIPISIENDARAATLGEHLARAEESQDLIYVKAGSGIGAGLLHRGEVVRGGSGVAGDITHVPVPGAEGRQCSCGRVGCLETVASGAAITQELLDQGVEISSMNDVVDLALTFHPAATAAIRRSGKQLGTALSPLVNFLNPSTVVIGGALSGVDAYVAAVRSAIYDSSLAMNTQGLTIATSSAGSDAALLGLARLAQELAPVRIPGSDSPA
ncbi:ROK family transcriptional regulator [Brachybacterium alimentarium]|uniref:ROK family transcriptional regulator n=1 Tax=Brachybacterium alimentarium TaxID=47845 RepID=UPI000BB888F9|nr:ROK family transcriptional regulator [Brachybacterium alimentarium]PCC32959.1 hypothetical protein CIK71_10155 [Brachybacterium alimentarium]